VSLNGHPYKDLVETTESNWDKDTLRLIAVESPFDTLEIESEFNWRVSEYPDTTALFKKVISAMQKGICHFSFEMVTNSGVKIAFGTISPKVMPADKGRTPVTISSNPSIPQTYWDLEAQDWRSFLPTHLITKV